MTVTINGIEVFETDVPDSDTRLHTIDLSSFESDFSDITFAEVRIIGWDNDSRETSGTGQFRINGIDVTGTVELGEDAILNASPTSLSGFGYGEGSGPSAPQSFQLSGQNLDDSDVTITAPDDFRVSLSSVGGFGTTITLNNYNGADTDIFVELEAGLSIGSYSGEIEISGGSADPIEVSVSGEVVEAFTIPYTNAFRSQENLDLAIIQGFLLSDAEWGGTGGGGYTQIFNGGYIESPIIDFSSYTEAAIDVSFSLTTFGGNTGQQISVQASNTGSEPFTNIATFDVPGSYTTFDTQIDLTD